MHAALAGFSVIELGHGAAMGYAGKLFADLGADVTRVTALRGISTSKAQPDSESDALALYLNARKKQIVDVSEAALSELISRSALVLYEPGHDSEPALDLAKTTARFPQLVIVSMTPFGLSGEARRWAADDLTLQAYGGISIGIGLPGKPPLKLPGRQSAFQTGLAAAIAALGALFSQRGASIDVAAADVWASFYSGVEVALAHFGRHGKRRAGPRVAGQPYPRTLFRCKDGYFAVQCGESRHWQCFLRMIGREDLLTHPLFSNRFKANDEHGDECDALVEPWFLARTKEEILRQCLEHRIPGAPVYDVREVVEQPHLRERAYFVEFETNHGRLKLPGHPFKALSGRSGTVNASRRHSLAFQGERSSVRPLAGLRVVDFGWVWAGAVPGHILADMGAEVIKVESASPLDYMRQGRPIVGTRKDPEQNPMFLNVNRGKLSLRVRLDHPEARAVVKDLVAKSDVVIENFSPGVMDKFGLGYRELQRVRPDLVMCSMSAVGQEGPLRGIRTYATMIASLAGLDSLVGYAGGRVLGSQSSYADPNASLHATVGILAALWRRCRTGDGAYIDLSQWEAAVCVMGEQVTDYALSGSVPAPAGIDHPHKAPHGHYPAAGDDRWIAISVSNDLQWHALSEALGNPEWMSADSLASDTGRRENRAHLDQCLALETARHDANALAETLASAGVPAAPVLDASELRSNPYFAGRELFEMVAHPVLGAAPVYRLPWRIDGKAISITRRAPLLGEHNDGILKGVLGYSEARIDELRAADVFS
ncbi:MAG: CoA transferase [Burkholderiales bacterium]